MSKPIIAYGDSNTVGHGLPGYTSPPAAQGYISVLAAELGVPVTLKASSGHMMADQSWSALYGTEATEANHYTVLLGTNDSQHYGSDPVKREAAMRFLRNILVWSLSPQKVLARDVGMAFTGAWSNTPVNSIGRMTSAAGAAAQATVTGTNIFVSYLLQNLETSEAAFEIYVDDVLRRTVVLNGTQIGNTLVGQTYAGACVEVSGLSIGEHVVRVVNVTSGKTLFVEFIAGSTQPSRPHAFVCQVPYRALAAYAGGNSDGNIDSYNAAISSLVESLSNAGFKTHFVPLVGFNRSVHYQSDGIHPNAAGHAVIAASFLPVIEAADAAPAFMPTAGIRDLYSMSFLGNAVASVTYN